MLTKAGVILLSGLVTAWGLGYVWRALGANGSTALALSSITLLLFVGFFGWLWAGISAVSLVVTDDTVSLVRRGVSLREFVRADTVFGSRVLRTFLNGLPGTGEQRSLTATTRRTARSHDPHNLAAEDVTSIPLDFLSRRDFALLFAELRCPHSRVSLSEVRTTAGLAPTSSEMLDDGNALGGILPQPGTGVPTNPLTWVIERRLILARTVGRLLRHALFAAMAATIATGVWLLFEAMDSITVVVFIVAAGLLMTVLLRRAVLPVVLGVFYLAWTLGVLCVQAVRIPASITIDGDTIHVGRRRFELARLREVSLTPLSYLPHARRLTLRTSRGRRLRWALGTSEPGVISEAGFTDYAAFTAALAEATARVSTRLVWDLD